MSALALIFFMHTSVQMKYVSKRLEMKVFT